MDHYLWCIRCGIIKPKIRLKTRQPKDHVWICRNCGSEVSEVAVPKGYNLVDIPLFLLELLIDSDNNTAKDNISGSFKE